MILYPILLSILALAAGVWIKIKISDYGFNKAYEQLKSEYNGK